MRILATTSIVIIASALSLPSVACDRHGGMFGQLSGASWTDYNPATAESDALFFEEQLSKWHERNAKNAADAKAAKPSFSKVTSRASLGAQARLAKRSKPAKDANVQPEVTPAKAIDPSETAAR
ncbi:MAG: hypothetical protein ABJN22_04870 [Litorimonas sp.]